MQKPILLVDCDDTIENFCEVWLNNLNGIYNTSYTVDDVADWDISNLFPVKSKDELLSIIDDAEFWELIKPLPKAQSSLLMLNMLYDVYIVSSGSYSSMCHKFNEVLKKYFWFIPEDRIICCHDKWLLTADYLIDDNVNNVMIGHVGHKYKGVIFTTPHNKYFNNEAFGIDRVDNWEDALMYFLKELNKEKKYV